MPTHSLTQLMIVQPNQTAEFLGSGLLPVLATPALIAFMENTAMQLIELPEGSSSVGTSISIKHLKATPIHAKIECTATITNIDGRKYTFTIQAADSVGDIIGEATHERVIVNIERFMQKLDQ